MISLTWKSNLIRKNGPISELKDGSDLALNNGLYILDLMNQSSEKSEIITFFKGLDIKEKDLRTKIDVLIQTNAVEELVKEQAVKKEKFIQKKKIEEEEEEGVEVTTIVIHKKLTQAEKKKLLKQQQNLKDNEGPQDN